MNLPDSCFCKRMYLKFLSYASVLTTDCPSLLGNGSMRDDMSSVLSSSTVCRFSSVSPNRVSSPTCSLLFKDAAIRKKVETIQWYTLHNFKADGIPDSVIGYFPLVPHQSLFLQFVLVWTLSSVKYCFKELQRVSRSWKTPFLDIALLNLNQLWSFFLTGVKLRAALENIIYFGNIWII